jgi:hypothetical protein
MSSAPSLLFLKRGRKHLPDALRSQAMRSIEIVAPDQLSTALLLEYAAPVFSAEVVPDTTWVVRLQPPPSGGGWVLELLKLVERWLDSARLPCANVSYGGRNYTIRTSTHLVLAEPSTARFGAAH